MASALLTAAESARFRKRLRDYSAASFNVGQLASRMGCSRTTAWRLLKSGNKSRVRRCYADSLAVSMNISKADLYSAGPRADIGLGSVLAEWRASNDKTRRRRAAFRLLWFVQESAVIGFEMRVTSSLSTSVAAEPAYLDFELVRGAARGKIQIKLNARDRRSVGMTYTDSKDRTIYNGDLNAITLRKILKKII